MKRTFLVVLAAALLSLNAKCSDCDKAKATAIAVCQAQGEESDQCKQAKADAEKICNPGPTPTPTPTPTPPPGPICEDGQYCDCYHNPTGEEWVLAGCNDGYKCSDAKQCVAIPTTCEPPCKTNEKCVERGSAEKYYECVPLSGPEAPLIPDEELTGVPDVGGVQMWSETSVAIAADRLVFPEKWREDGSCLIDGVAGIDAAFQRFSNELLRKSIIAGQSISNSGARSDALFVNRTGTDLYEEFHLFDYSRACVATGPNAYRGLYRRTVSPVVDYGCPAPLPPRVRPDTGGFHWFWKAKQHTMGNADSTAVVDRACDYCASIGMGCLNDDCSVKRCQCPVRPDGHVDRPACERYLLDGDPTRDSRNGQDCAPNNTDNPMAFLYGTGNCRMCNPKKTNCSEWL